MDETATGGTALGNAEGRKPVRERRAAGPARRAQRALRAAGAILGAALVVGAVAAPVWAQAYPNKPIRFIVPWPPGGATDFLGRIIAPRLAERLGQPVVVENHGGAGGNVGHEYVAKAKPDGYTVMMGTMSMTTPTLHKALRYDPIKDFAPIWMLGQSAYVFVVKPSLPVKTLKEFVEYAKARPGKVTYGSAGVGGGVHLAGELLKSLTKVDMVHVPYKGVGPALIGLISGEVDMTMGAPAGVLPHMQAGKVKALAVLGNAREPSLPDVPTAKEAGFERFVVLVWWGLLAPAGTPRDIVNRLHAELIKIAAMPDIMGQIRKAGAEPVPGSTPEQFSDFLKLEVSTWTRVIKEAGIPAID